MTKPHPLSYLFILLVLVGCQNSTQKENAIPDNSGSAATTVDSLSKNTGTNDKPNLQQEHQYRYVSAKSGLNYRATPKGKLLGKFSLNQEVKVIEYTDVKDQVMEDKGVIKGEWLGIEKGLDTVYVFSGFLSESMTMSDIVIFPSSPYSKTEKNSGFVDLSDLYSFDQESEIPTLLHESDLGKEKILFNQKQKKQFLKSTGISTSDTVFIYNLNTDAIYKFSVQDLSGVAIVNVYSSGDENLREYQYEFGFDLGEKYTDDGMAFTCVEEKNPFQVGKIKSILWREIEKEAFPLKYKSAQIPDHRKKWFVGVDPAETYKFTNNNLDYYIQNLTKEGQFHHRYLMVIDRNTQQVVFEESHTSSESINPMPLRVLDMEGDYDYQWTGSPFKNKPPIVYGFLSNSFGCEGVYFLKPGEPTARILCDNRH